MLVMAEQGTATSAVTKKKGRQGASLAPINKTGAHPPKTASKGKLLLTGCKDAEMEYR
jgi:hypothetical protein